MKFLRKMYYFSVQKIFNNIFLRHHAVEIVFQPKKTADILLLTVAFNNPRGLEWQLSLCERFLDDDHVHIILDNSSSPRARRSNKNICLRHKAVYVSLPCNPWTGIHNSRSHGISLDWAFRYIVPHYSFQVLGLLDHDVFPIQRHSLLADMNERQYMGVLQERPGLWYLWPGFFFVRATNLNLSDFSMLPTRKADTGGALWRKVFCRMDKRDIFFVKEQEYRLREGASRQSSFYYRMGRHWVHTVNASYWNGCTPKENDIVNILQNEFGIVLPSDSFEMIKDF